MKSWGLALMSLGCISIMTGPMLMDNYMWMIIQGLILIVIGFVLVKREKK